MVWEMTESLVAVLLKWELGLLSFDSSLAEIIFVVGHLSMVIRFLLLPIAVMANELQDAFEENLITRELT